MNHRDQGLYGLINPTVDRAIDEWNARYRRPADDIRDLRAALDRGDIDFSEFELCS